MRRGYCQIESREVEEGFAFSDLDTSKYFLVTTTCCLTYYCAEI